MRVHSTKYDGSLHYEYPITPVAASATERRVYVPPGTTFVSYRGQWPSKHHMLMLYWSDRPYNLHLSWFFDWRPRLYYVNIATPATWDEDTIRFVDLDLDVVWYRDRDELKVDDEDEFEAQRGRFGYPDGLVREAREAVAEVRAAIGTRQWPFDGSLEAWRPA
jgi:protein associated with RNAse G/E